MKQDKGKSGMTGDLLADGSVETLEILSPQYRSELQCIIRVQLRRSNGNKTKRNIQNKRRNAQVCVKSRGSC